jgi:hypothetical protein
MGRQLSVSFTVFPVYVSLSQHRREDGEWGKSEPNQEHRNLHQLRVTRTESAKTTTIPPPSPPGQLSLMSSPHRVLHRGQRVIPRAGGVAQEVRASA